jgi:hypothetical protein
VNPPSTTTKAYVGAAIAVCAAIAGMFAESTIGKLAAILAAGLTAYLGVFKAKNTETVETGPGEGSVKVGTVVSKTGQVVGEVVADTGTATGGVIAGTTGLVGQVLNATVGKVLPTSGTGRHG